MSPVRFARLDPLAREIQEVLECIRPELQTEVHPRYEGYAVSAAEAYLHLAGGRDANVRVMRHKNGTGRSHWWLEDEDGKVLDLTLGPADRRIQRSDPSKAYPYDEGTPAMFRRGYERASRRARAIIELVEASRSTA